MAARGAVPTLVYNPGELDEKAFQIGDAAVTIGRAEDQTICIPHKSLSRSHARIEPSGGCFVVLDLHSKNGTFVNGTRVQEQTVRHGDTITLGDLDLLFTTASAAAGDAAAPELAPQVVRPLMRAPIARFARRHDGGAPIDPSVRIRTRLRLLIEVAKLLPVSDDTDTLLRKALDLLFQLLEVDRGAILLLDEPTRKLTPRAVKTARPTPENEPIYSQNIVDYVQHRSVAALFADASGDPRLGPAESVVLQSIRSSMCVPLKPRDEIIGVLYVDNQRSSHLYTEDDLDFLVAFASQVAVALENAALCQRLERETVERMHLVMEAKLASLGTMVSGMAHEIRNPLNFIINFAALSQGLAEEMSTVLEPQRARLSAEAVADVDGTLAHLRENAGRIVEHGRRADAIIQRMLQHGRRPQRPRELGDVNGILAESVRLARGGAREGNFELRVVEDYDPAIGPIEMAPQDIARVFLNLVENAIDALREKSRTAGQGFVPELHVRTEARGDSVEIHVRDNGTGIPAAIAGEIFNPFFTTKAPGHGTGLGLSLSHDIVVQGHQGSLRMESAEGEWAELTVTLPRAKAARPAR